jgi:uncharacterized protein
VPLLVLAAGYDERSATGTSLAAIGLIALAGTVSYSIRGEVDVGAAALLGLPAALGAVAGARLQQRLATRTLLLGLAVLLVTIAVYLVL